MFEKKVNIELSDSYVDIKKFLLTLKDYGDDYNFVLLHCYAHIKNEEIYLEIDKDIYEHVVIYEGKNFFDAVDQYFFMMKKGAILAYKKDEIPNIKMTDFIDSYDDFNTFKKQIEEYVKTNEMKPEFYILSTGENADLYIK